MKFNWCWLIVVVLLMGKLNAQNLHNYANAASVNDEANSTTGWTGTAIISSDGSDVQHGDYAIKGVSTANDGRTLDYTFSAEIGQQYTIRIWAKIGLQLSNDVEPAFAVWN